MIIITLTITITTITIIIIVIMIKTMSLRTWEALSYMRNGGSRPRVHAAVELGL